MKAARLSPQRRRTAFQPGRSAFVAACSRSCGQPESSGSDGFLEFLRGAERDLLARLDLDRLAGRGVAAHAGGALANLKDAEATDADAVALLEVLHNEL